MAAERIIGVDFGTSTSVIRVKRYEDGQPIGERLEAKEVIFGDRALVPTVISKKDDGGSVPYFGYEAQPGKKNHTCYHSFKMDLESSDPEKRAQARELTEEFFCFLGKKYKSQSDGGHLGNTDDEERTIVSYPVKWNEGTKSFMLKAAAKAGFPNVTGMDEAQAAIQAVLVMNADHLNKNGLLQNGVGSNVLLIDMGAGTTDLVLARYTPGAEAGVEVLNTWPKSGEIQFGGREIDHLLQNYFRQMMDENVAEMILTKVSSDKFKSWKEANVSPSLRENDSVDSFNELDTLAGFFGLDLDYCLDRAAFENCLADYLKQFPQLINGCLQNAGMTGNDVDLVIVTGGHSQWYFVSEMLEGKMPQFGEVDLPKIKENSGRIIPISRPQETVALGLAYNGIHDTSVDEPTPLLTDRISKPTFTMEIRQIISKPEGLVVEGTISLGEVIAGDTVYIWDNTGEKCLSATIKRIGLCSKNNGTIIKDAAAENDVVAVRLDGIMATELSQGMILFKDTNEFRHAPLQLVQESVERCKERQPVVPNPDNGEEPDSGNNSNGGNTSNVGKTINGGALGIGSVVYTIPQGKSIPGAIQSIMKFLVSKKMEVQELKTEEGYVVQARKKGLFNKNASALEIRLAPTGDDQVAIKVGGGKWASIAAKSGGAIVSTLVLGPLAPIGAIAFIISAGVDAQLISDTKKLIKDYFTC